VPKQTFADIILPLALPKCYTYSIPEKFLDNIHIGSRILVQFGQKKYYSSIVYKTHQTPPSKYKTKPILAIIDEHPVVNEIQIKLWEWMSTYYMCSLGEIMHAALPSGLKLSSETQIKLHPEFNDDLSQLNDKEYLIAETLNNNSIIDLSDISAILDIKHAYPVVKSLIDKKIIVTEESIQEKYKPKKIKYIQLSEIYKNESLLEELFQSLEKAPKQMQLLLSYISITNFHSIKETKPIAQQELLKACNSNHSTINSLVKKYT